MSDLWMILVLLGVSIVLAVVAFNWWQEKKYRRDVEYRFSQNRVDVLDTETPAAPSKRESGIHSATSEKHTRSEDVEGWMSEPRVRQAPKVEPGFSVEPSKPKKVASEQLDHSSVSKLAAELQFTQGQQSAVQPIPPQSFNPQQSKPGLPESAVSQEALAFATAPDASETSDASAGISEQPQLVETPQVKVILPPAVNPVMDLVGVIAAPLGVATVELEDLLAEVKTFPQHATLWALNGAANAPSHWLDLLGIDSAGLQNLSSVTQLVCGLQLADRGGPVDADTLKRFQKSIETLARQLGLQVEWQGENAPAQQAQMIDAFCIEVDKAVEFHVLAGQGMFHATKLRGLAEASGLRLSEQGRFELISSDGHLAFSVRNYEGKPFSTDMLKTAVMTGITFQLDIPTTPNNVQVFDHMIEVARGIAQSLGGSMIDVNRKPIGDTQLSKIRQQLKTISSAMAEKGILPGSSHAKRLFS
ncbi:cell division protein ZipA C-terminal FtsZ-binding domain-containing protein [Methylophilus aquaticus]|uniref:Cell division protein ZipA n=1 Tax=Methylophilus aquaticus TaxID=1971610 RepID=A0ABT9JS72_9PROT|nr:cell division protein ZipA C-terminal FtsZ-binding domain-containing protein [Methylophilus aquaticus]MDP8566966.1 cell division protein ZipA C-terminal FtsZ-binding domain-containing protein [Methylophilus aquaticus]